MKNWTKFDKIIVIICMIPTVHLVYPLVSQSFSKFLNPPIVDFQLDSNGNMRSVSTFRKPHMLTDEEKKHITFVRDDGMVLVRDDNPPLKYVNRWLYLVMIPLWCIPIFVVMNLPTIMRIGESKR